MITIDLVGIGTGNPDHLTFQACRAVQEADCVLLPRKGADKEDLVDVRRTICAQLGIDRDKIAEFDMPLRAASSDRQAYARTVHDWHDAIAQAWIAAAQHNLPQGGRLALLVWGDPSLYDSTLRIAARLQAGGQAHTIRVVPGITSLQALTAAHAIPLNPLAGSVTITTGRLLREQGWPEGVACLAVMLDGHCAFETLAPEDISIWWGAYLGMAHEALDHGPLALAAPRIACLRAQLRARHGWIMDIYLMRKEQADERR